jgi:hypothetical protein
MLSDFEPLRELSAPEQKDSASGTGGTIRQEEGGNDR